MVAPDETASYRPATQLLHSKFPALQRTSATCGELAASAEHAGSCSSRALDVIGFGRPKVESENSRA